jgi:hypothetical protein
MQPCKREATSISKSLDSNPVYSEFRLSGTKGKRAARITFDKKEL